MLLKRYIRSKLIHDFLYYSYTDCGAVPKIKDGSYKLDKKKDSTFEATASLKCDEDFFVKNDDDTITCEESGSWSKIGKCEEVQGKCLKIWLQL